VGYLPSGATWISEASTYQFWRDQTKQIYMVILREFPFRGALFGLAI